MIKPNGTKQGRPVQSAALTRSPNYSEQLERQNRKKSIRKLYGSSKQ